MRGSEKHVCGICLRRATRMLGKMFAPPARRGHILVVDDTPEVASLIRFILEGAGYEVEEAADGVEALELARATRPDLILMNFLMPRMDGLEALRRLKKDSILCNLRVVMHSARGRDPDFMRMAGEAGALGSLTVPFAPKQLLAAVERALRD